MACNAAFRQPWFTQRAAYHIAGKMQTFSNYSSDETMRLEHYNLFSRFPSHKERTLVLGSPLESLAVCIDADRGKPGIEYSLWPLSSERPSRSVSGLCSQNCARMS